MNRKPDPGDIIYYIRNGDEWPVHHTRDNICYSQEDESSDGKQFIYQFADGEFNTMHIIREELRTIREKNNA